MRDKITSRSRDNSPTSSTMLKGISDAQYDFGISPHVNYTNNVGLEKVMTKIRQLDEKFNTMHSSLNAVIAKFGIMM
jgi:hypothetical protein